MSNQLYTRLHHGKESCSACGKSVGRDQLKACASCRLVRYCSKSCQRDAWPTHKTRCNDVRDTIDNPEDAFLYSELTHWKNEWSGALRYISLWAFDLVNNPRDRLATHCMMIQIEPRPNRPSRARAFTMMHGQVLSRDAFLELCDKNEAPKAMVDTFKTDLRGNNCVQIVIICESFFRLIWFQFPEAELERARSKKPSVSSTGADYWDDGLKDAIEAGDPSDVQNCFLNAIGRRNTLIYDVPVRTADPRR